MSIAPGPPEAQALRTKDPDALLGIIGRGEGVFIFRPARPRDQHHSNTSMLRAESHEMPRKVQSALDGNASRNRPAYLGQVRLAL